MARYRSYRGHSVGDGKLQVGVSPPVDVDVREPRKQVARASVDQDDDALEGGFVCRPNPGDAAFPDADGAVGERPLRFHGADVGVGILSRPPMRVARGERAREERFGGGREEARTPLDPKSNVTRESLGAH